MFCIQEAESPHSEPFRTSDKDPLNIQSDSSDDEPSAKRIKFAPELNLQVYQIPAFSTPKSLSNLTIFPTTTNSLPKFVNNPLNLANPLAFATSNLNANNIVKNLHSRYSLPAKLTITPVNKTVSDGEVVRYKKNGEVAKKRGPPKGYKRKPKDLSQSFSNGALLQAQNTILTSLLAANTTLTTLTIPTPLPEQRPQIKLPPGTELVELLLDPEDWFPTEPYRMVFSRKKNPKWKNFPYRCEHCFKVSCLNRLLCKINI
ncbi:jg17690 [Pararge aegeria aegeria]|uniref:Jg17690 protein n=1 Tax=Pararge aegeria aegeria TaxID=348720 RepID=A0A8S4SBZ2_9NEOP|nr:jg17690 [Pararge aegeria aegeria]